MSLSLCGRGSSDRLTQVKVMTDSKMTEVTTVMRKDRMFH